MLSNPRPSESTYHELLAATKADREFLLGAPVISRAMAGQLTRDQYLAFLTEAWHHVSHTVQLLMAVGSRLPASHKWLQQSVLHYLEEEQGHDDWILNDIKAAGGDPAQTMRSTPRVPTAAMIAYAYDMVMRRNPTGFFGMVLVLEGTSVALACQAADRIQQALHLPDNAFTYLRSHGELDKEHVHDLAGILERLPGLDDRQAILDCAQAMYWLYGSMFRSLDGSTVNR